MKLQDIIFSTENEMPGHIRGEAVVRMWYYMDRTWNLHRNGEDFRNDCIVMIPVIYFFVEASFLRRRRNDKQLLCNYINAYFLVP
jgi:hypothetical protein